MNELQTSRLPSNFYVYEKNDYHSLDCQQESEELLEVIKTARKESDVQDLSLIHI